MQVQKREPFEVAPVQESERREETRLRWLERTTHVVEEEVRLVPVPPQHWEGEQGWAGRTQARKRK